MDLICSLYSWWEGFGSSSLATLPLGFICGFISTSTVGDLLGIVPEALLEGLCLPLRGAGVELGLQGFWQHQLLKGFGGQGSRKYSALEGYGNQYWPQFQYSCLENHLPDGEGWQDTVYRVAKHRT